MLKGQNIDKNYEIKNHTKITIINCNRVEKKRTRTTRLFRQIFVFLLILIDAWRALSGVCMVSFLSMLNACKLIWVEMRVKQTAQLLTPFGSILIVWILF